MFSLRRISSNIRTHAPGDLKNTETSCIRYEQLTMTGLSGSLRISCSTGGSVP